MSETQLATPQDEDWGIGDVDRTPEADQDHRDADAEGETSTSTAKERPSKRVTKRPRNTRGRAGGLTVAQARKAIDVMHRIQGASDAELAITTLLAGIDGDRDDLTAAILTGKATAASSLADLREIDDADASEAAVTAAMMGRPRMKDVWELLRTVGADLPADLPDADTKLAVRLAPAVKGLTDEDNLVLLGAAELLTL